MNTKLRRGDKVQVIAGKSRGAIGKIMLVNRKRGFFLVEGVNMQKKHVKPNQRNQRGGIIEKEGPIHFSNVLLYSEEAKRGSRIRLEIDAKGRKKRVFTKTGKSK